jgi:hypothetical protein
MNGLLGDEKPSWDQLCVCIDCPDPPLSCVSCMVRTDPLSLTVMIGLHELSSEQEFFSTQNSCRIDL